MDRFVTRTPTWKTLNYTTIANQSLLKKECLLKKAAVDNKKKPLQQKQMGDLSSYSNNSVKRLEDLLASSHQVIRDNFNTSSNDSGLSSSSSISPQRIDDNTAADNATSYIKLPTPSDNRLNYTVEKENDAYMAITRTPQSYKKVLEPSHQVQKTLKIHQVKDTPDKPLPTANNMLLARIQRDLNSPSAATRLKAIKAMKAPTESAYSHFDIPDAEQSLHLPEPPSLQEIMRNIVVYVEVRSGEDNRSDGVRKVIEAMGARVNLSLNREITHVVFKDGLMSTFKKARQMSIPIVSILWIEACKSQCRICDPKDYPISNLDRYENPELYTKMKRIKCMQPDSECNKRIRAKAGGTPKDSTPTQKTGNLKKTSTLIGGTPTNSKIKKKTDISQFFKKIERSTPSSAFKVDETTIQESPATQLLNRIHSQCYTPLDKMKQKTSTKENNNNNNIQDFYEDNDHALKFGVDAKRTLNFLDSDRTEGHFKASIKSDIVVGIENTIEASPRPKSRARRHSLMANCEIETAMKSVATMAISVSTPRQSSNRRRSSIHTPEDMSVVVAKTPSKINNIQTILEESSSEGEKNQTEPKKSISRRRTLYALKTMDQTDLMKSKTIQDVDLSNTKSTRRRTLYTNKTIDTSEIKDVVSNLQRTCFDNQSEEQNQISKITDSKVAKTTTGEIIANGKKLDLNNEVEMGRPVTATKVNKPTNRRRTLYGAQIIRESNIITFKDTSSTVTTDNSVCLTPTNFKMDGVVSSTLLDDNDNRSKLVATPHADATFGKLLEETEQCTTPLIFSSNRQPGSKRRTLFDVSMDIITQRLQCINQSARRSLAPPTPSAELMNPTEQHLNTPIDFKNSNDLLNSATPKSSSEILNECTNSNGSINVNTPKTNKRKLFVPNDMLATAPLVPLVSTKTGIKTSEESNILVTKISNKTASNSVTKRRRTLMPISQPQPTINVAFKDSISHTTSTPVVRKRRSTLDFEQIQNLKEQALNFIAKDSTLAASVSKNTTQHQIKTRKPPVLVHTNMHQEQIDVIREAVDKLGLFVLESCVTNATTHLISLEPRRTLNLLRALARGLWILDYSWIVDSLKAGKWLPEESHELQNFSRAIEICRSERQAFGNSYKCELFRDIGAFYISSQCCRPINKEDMRELITLCGGHVVSVRQKAHYIIGNANRTLQDKLYLTPYWVLDSITQMHLMKFNKYLYHLVNGRSASQSLPPDGKN